MQTFLPYPDFQQTVKCLDWRRLGKQRVEAKQILSVISPTYQHRGWINHPAAKMWRGYSCALTIYMNACIQEWIKRGYNNTMQVIPVQYEVVYPPWLGNEHFHASHRSNLLRKDAIWYGQFGWLEHRDLPYVWP